MARELFTYILKYWVFTSEKLPKKAVFDVTFPEQPEEVRIVFL